MFDIYILKILDFGLILSYFLVTSIASQAQAATRKYFHSSYVYNRESSKIIHLDMDENMPDDIASYKIYLTKSEDINAPLSAFMEEETKRYNHIRRIGNYLQVHYSLKTPFETPGWPELTFEEQQAALTAFMNLPEWGYDFIDISDPFHPLPADSPPQEGSSSNKTGAKIGFHITSDNILRLEDTTDPNHTVTSSLALDNDANLGNCRTSLQQDYLYIIRWEFSKFYLYIISIKDISKPSLVKKYLHNSSNYNESFFKTLSFYTHTCTHVQIVDNCLYIVGKDNRCDTLTGSGFFLRIIDISDPLNLKRVGEGYITSNFSDFVIENGFALLIDKIPPTYGVTEIPAHEQPKPVVYEQEIHSNRYNNILFLIDTRDIIRHCAEKLTEQPYDINDRPYEFVDFDVQPLKIIPIKGTTSDLVIEENIGYLSLFQGGIQIVEIPAYCRNLHWLNAKTLSVEIAMPISPGLYNVVVEVTEEEAATEPSNDQAVDQNTDQTNDQSADQTNDQTSDQTADQGGQTNDQGTSSYDELAAHFQSVMGKYLLANPYDPYMQRLQSSLSTNLFTRSSHWLEKSPFLTAFFYPLQDLFSPPVSSYNVPLGLIPTWCPLWLSPYLTQESLENYYFMLNNK